MPNEVSGAPKAQRARKSKRIIREDTREHERQNFPKSWDEQRVQKVIAHYESLTGEEEAGEDEPAWNNDGITMVAVPNELVNKVRDLITREQK